MSIPSVRVRVSGEFACFTRPEAKVERFSYPVMTPSAARNILDAICWRPQMRWIVTSITVLKPIRLMSVLRNEVQSKASIVTTESEDGEKQRKQSISFKAIERWMADPSKFSPLVAGAGNGTDGTPRNTTLLRDIAYWIDAYPHVFDVSGDNTPVKYVEMMRRRVEKGQCFQRPYLGCREFAAEFGPPLEDDQPIPASMEIGRMLYDIAFLSDGNRAAFFEARLENGVMETRPETVLADQGRRQEVLECSFRR
jgi:CRISPR-associated protein Cas5d